MRYYGQWLCVFGVTAIVTACGPVANETSTPGESEGVSDNAFTSASGVPMRFISSGTFRMGSDREASDEQPVHEVRVDSFLIDQYEVYHELFAQAQLPNPSRWQDNPRKPVEQVRWRDAKEYCNERSRMDGLELCYDESQPGWPCDFSKNGYRLPTEAEWEYAARAGTVSRYPFGDENKLKQHAWFADNANEKTYPVGVKKPNPWGVHDMYGNVSEWCQDVYEADYYSQSPAENPKGPDAGTATPKRVMRGGSWKSSADMCRVTFRQGQQTGDTDACFYTDFCGFRCVRSLSREAFLALVAESL